MDNESGALYWTDRGELPLGNTLNKKQMVGDVPASEKPLGRQILAQGFGEAIGLRLDKKKDVVWVSDIVSTPSAALSDLLADVSVCSVVEFGSAIHIGQVSRRRCTRRPLEPSAAWRSCMFSGDHLIVST